MAVITDSQILASGAKECVSGRPTTLELTIITVAAICSVAMKLIQSSRDRTHSNAGQQTFMMISVIILSPVTSIITASVALGLGWARTISIDALAAVLFALIPGVLSLPLDSFHDTVLRLGLLSKGKLYESLRTSEHRFQYIKVGYRCSIKDNLELDGDERRRICPESKEETPQFYVARFPPRYSWFVRGKRWLNVLLPKFQPQKCGTEGNSVETQRVCFIDHLNGKCGQVSAVEESDNITIYISNRGFHYRVYRSVMSALWLTQEPWRVFLDTSEQVLHAFVLLLDILMIGNLVLIFHKKYLLECRNEKGPKWKFATNSSSLIQRQLIRELKIVDWLPEYLLPLHARDEECQMSSDKEYLSFLFLLLIEKSDKFRKRKYVKHISEADTTDAPLVYRSGSSLLREAVSMHCDRSELLMRLKRMVDQWLVSWGCDRSVETEDDGLRMLMTVKRL